jgi:hypothetical protein
MRAVVEASSPKKRQDFHPDNGNNTSISPQFAEIPRPQRQFGRRIW